MASENFTPVEYEALKQALRIKMKSDPRFKDYDFEGSGLSSIIKMMSSMASSQNLNSHFVLGESHFSTSDVLGNVQALVTASNGYVPASQTSSRAIVDITVTPTEGVTPPSSLTLSQTFTTLGLQDGASFRFTPLTSVTTPLSDGKYEFKDVIMVEGELVTNTFVQNGSDVSYFTIPNKKIDINTISVVVRESISVATSKQFERFHSAFQLGISSELFFLSMDRNGHYRVNFGDGRFSKSLDDGNVVYVTYKSSSGAASNGVSKLTASSEIGGFNNVSVVVKNAASGGTAQEGIQSIQMNAPLAYGMDGVAVSTKEYGLKLKELYPSLKVTQWDGSDNNPPKPGFVILSTYPALSAPEKDEGIAWLRTYSVGSIMTQIVDSGTFDVNVRVFFVSSYSDPSKVTSQKSEIKAFCSNYAKMKADFGSTFEPNDFEESLKSAVSGIERCYVTYVMGATPVISKKSATFDFHREIDAETFSVVVSGSLNIDSMKIIGGEMVGFKGAVRVRTFSFSLTNGLLVINDLTSVLTRDGVTASFGVGTAAPGGDDLMVYAARDELLTLKFEI